MIVTRRRAVTAIASAAFWLSVVTPAASAATGITRWVDDDLGAGGGPRACATASYTSIQAAIDDSTAGDRVYVCPGVFTEQLTIDKRILVRAKPLHGAIIEPPAAGGPIDVLVSISADGARLRGFQFRFPAGDLGTGDCSHVGVAIAVTGEGDVVRNNKLSTTGVATLTGACGYDAGILIVDVSARVTFNRVTDFRQAGIVTTRNSSATIVRNAVRFTHSGEAACGAFSKCEAIGVFIGGDGYVARNAVYAGLNACLRFAGCPVGSTPGMIGIYLADTVGATVKNNAVYHTLAGLYALNTKSTLIVNNELTKNDVGILVDGDASEVTGNVVSRNHVGAFISGSENNLHDNDFRGNSGVDCQDGTTGTGTAGTANTWTNNLGYSSLPDGLCRPPTV